jgi:N-acetylglucosamine-6-phosphate deacetylase
MNNFIDLQVNGYGGVDFNQNDLSPDALHRACEMLQQHDVTHILATIITEDLETMCRRLANLARLRATDPLAGRSSLDFTSRDRFSTRRRVYFGAHPPNAIRPATVEAMKQLLDSSQGLTRMVTLAPERDAGFQ